MPIPKWKEITSDPRWGTKTPEQQNSIREQWLNDVASENPDWGNKEIAELKAKTSLVGSAVRRPTSLGTSDTPNAAPIIDKAAAMAKMLMPTTVKEGLEQGGAMVGEFVAGPTGAGLAGGAGNILGQMFEQGAVPPIWTGGANYTPAIGSPNINWDEAGKAAALNAGTAGVGKYGSRAVMKAGWPASKTLKSEALEAEKFLKPYGGELAANQKTEGAITGFFGNMAEYGETGKRTMQKFHEQYQSEPIRKAIADIANKLGKGSPIDSIDSAGLHLKEGIIGNKKAIAAKFAQDYKPLDDIKGSPSVDMSEVLSIANEIVSKQPVRGSEAGRIAQSYIDKLQPMETFERAMIEQSDLFELPGGTKQLIGNYDKKNITKMRRAYIKAIDKAAKDIPMPVEAGSDLSNYQRQLIQERTAADMIKELRRAYAGEMKPFNNRWVNQVYNTEGGTQVFNKAFDQSSPSQIVKLKEALGSQNKWEQLQASWMQDKLKDKWINDNTGLFDYKKMIAEIKDMGDSYNVLFDGSQRKAIDEFVNTVRFLEGRNKSKAGAIWIQLKQASALSTLGGATGVYTSDDKGKGALTGIASGALFALAAPYGMAKIFTNPTATRYLSRALREGTYDTAEELAAQMLRFTGVRAAREVWPYESATPPSQ